MAYTVLGPAHFGITTNVSITIEAPFVGVGARCRQPHELTFDLTEISEHATRLLHVHISQSDFDYMTATSPISLNEVFTLLLLCRNQNITTDRNRQYWGIVVREVRQSQYERIGSIYFEQVQDSAEFDVADWVASLSVSQFTIM